MAPVAPTATRRELSEGVSGTGTNSIGGMGIAYGRNGNRCESPQEHRVSDARQQVEIWEAGMYPLEAVREEPRHAQYLLRDNWLQMEQDTKEGNHYSFSVEQTEDSRAAAALSTSTTNAGAVVSAAAVNIATPSETVTTSGSAKAAAKAPGSATTIDLNRSNPGAPVDADDWLEETVVYTSVLASAESQSKAQRGKKQQKKRRKKKKPENCDGLNTGIEAEPEQHKRSDIDCIASTGNADGTRDVDAATGNPDGAVSIDNALNILEDSKSIYARVERWINVEHSFPLLGASPDGIIHHAWMDDLPSYLMPTRTTPSRSNETSGTVADAPLGNYCSGGNSAICRSNSQSWSQPLSAVEVLEVKCVSPFISYRSDAKDDRDHEEEEEEVIEGKVSGENQEICEGNIHSESVCSTQEHRSPRTLQRQHQQKDGSRGSMTVSLSGFSHLRGSGVGAWHVPQLQLEMFCVGAHCRGAVITLLSAQGARIYRMPRDDQVYLRERK